MPNLLNIFPEWMLIASGVTIGIIAIFGLFDTRSKEKGKEKDNLEDRIRELYQEESKALQEKVESLGKEVQRLTTENEVITKIFQGRDGQTVEFQKQGFEAMKNFASANKTISETHKLAAQSHNGQSKILKSIEKLSKLMEKHLETEMKMASSLSTHSPTVSIVTDNRPGSGTDGGKS